MIRTCRILPLLLLLLCFQTGRAEWIKQNTNSFAWFHDVFFVNQSRGWIVGSDGVMLSTDNAGQAWTPYPKFTTDTFRQVYFTSETTGWLLCERNVYARGAYATSYLRKTTDGGRTWSRIEFEDGGRERVTHIFFNKNGVGSAFGEGGIFYKLQEDGTTWKKSKTAIHFLLLDGAFSSGSIGAIVGTGGTALFSEDNGLTWDKASLLGDLDTRFNAVAFAGDKAIMAVGTKGRIFRSNGGGRLWRQIDSGTTVDLNDVIFTDSSNGWAVGDNGIIVRTRDGGKTWTDGNSPATHNLEKITFIGSRGWAVGFGGTVLAYDPSSSKPDTEGKPSMQKRN